MTERVRHEEQLRHQAFHDPLTGLANRAFFLEELAHTIARLGRTDRVAAVLMVDLDGFKVLNDTLGHAAGDEVLTEAARTLQTCVREGDVVARLGGDEFAILLGDLLDLSEARAVAERIETTLAEPIEVVGTRVPLSASVGIASGSGNSTTADRLMREADVAMYAAKRGGKGRYEVFEASLHRRTIEHLELQSELRDAVGRDQLFVQYQPLVQLDTRRVVGVEALVRWRHPERGLVPPVEFIPLAEETGLIVDVGRFVLTRACAEAKTWSGAPGAPWVSVNVSVGELESKDFVEHVRRVLDATGLPPSSLVLEVTESAVVPDGGATFTALRRLRRLGVRIAVDDFGTGYSSLAHLRRMPLDMLKIDKTFVDGLSAGPEDAAIASAIVRLGRTMHLDVVAEGVEREDQAIALSRLRCGYAQGFLFSPAVDPDDIRGFIAGKAPWVPAAVLPAPDSPHSELVARA